MNHSSVKQVRSQLRTKLGDEPVQRKIQGCTWAFGVLVNPVTLSWQTA